MEHLGRSPVLLLTMLAFVLGEAAWRTLIVRRGYNVRGAFVSLGLGAGNVLFGSAQAVVLAAIFLGAARLAPVRWPLGDWKTWLAGFLAVEFAYYLFHRASHRVRWIWASHAVHHSPDEMTFLSAIRLGWTNLLSGGWLFQWPLVLAGFDPRLVFALLAFNLHYQFFLHTESIGRLGPLEWVLNTPAHHRVHHGSNAAYLDRNFGGVLIVFDRLFGTFAAERPDEPIRYGLVHPFGTNNPLGIAFGEWRRLLRDLRGAGSLRNAARIALGAP